MVTFNFAKDQDGIEIPIHKARSGANGYRCIGCNSAMIACIGEFQAPHFRHLATDVSVIKECTWSDETYRHQVAKSVLQIKKEIVVPPVKISIPPEYGDGEVIIQPAQVIKASQVLIERYVYLDLDGSVRYTRDEGNTQRLICVKPDVLFLDAQGKIILMIELCATHKVDLEKRAKLQLIKIDSVEVKIPPVPTKEEIDPIFTQFQYTEWLYNNEQSTTKFDPNIHKVRRAGAGITKGRASLQQKEDEKCRAFRIRNLIRQIERCMESFEFGSAEDRIKQDIEQAKHAERKASQELQHLSNRIRDAAQARIKTRAGLESEDASKYRELESRYQSKSSQLDCEERAITKEENELWSRFRAEEARIAESIREEEAKYVEELNRTGNTIEQHIIVAGNRVEEFRNRVAYLRDCFDPIRSEEARISAEEEYIEREIRATSAKIESAQRAYQQITVTIEGAYNNTERVNEEIRRITGVKNKYIAARDQTFGRRSNR